MADLLASTDYKVPSLRRGQEVSGKIVFVSAQEILVDIGAKSEGIVTGREFTVARDVIENLKVGDVVEASVLFVENDAGQVVLSMSKLSSGKRWDQLESKKKDNEEIEVKAVEANRGGLICEFAGLRGFLPTSLLGTPVARIEDLVGHSLSVRVVEADRVGDRLIFSQKLPGKRDLDALIKKLAKIKIGQNYKGTVSAVLPFGIFVEIDQKLEGLVHISEISWEKIEDPAKVFKVGDEVEVAVVAKDMTGGRLNLSIKQLTEDPFTRASEKYSKDQKVQGKVSKVTPYGIFVTLDAGIEGLMHNSKIPPNLSYEPGDEVECEIESVDTAARKISLVPVIREKPVLYR